MSIGRGRRIRVWVATLVAAVYAFGVLGPTLAFSLQRDVSIMHSLTESHGGSIILHVHHDDTDHGAHAKPGPHAGHQCCGIFTIAALSGAYAPFSIFEAPFAFVRIEPKDMQALRRPSRLDRPPRNHAVI